MKIYWIDAAKREITEAEASNNDLYKRFPGGLCIGATFANGDVLYVDDEGLLNKATVAFRIRRRRDGQPMMSNGALSGRDDGKIVDGELIETTLDPAMSLDELQDEIEWLSVDEALDWFRARVNEPAVLIGNEPVMDWSGFLAHLEGKS
jgi:hypothetical protein